MKKTENLHIKLNYESAVSVLPSSVIELVDRAKKFDIKVLLLISSSDTYRMDGGITRMSSELGCEEKDVEASLAFWNGAGVIDVVEEKSEKTKKSAKENKEEVKKEETAVPIAKRVKVSDLPQYTTEELNALLEKHEGICALIDECQQILGKMFNTSEVKILMGLVDHLELDEEYILVLMHYCNEIEKRSLRYVEKVAISCLDEGITEAHVLQQTLHAREENRKIENRIRGIFGISNRAFTTKEKGLVANWVGVYGFDFDVITKAYEITVNATGKASIPYANAILEKWYSEGLKTVEQVEAYLSKAAEEKESAGQSFELDEFFNAAISRSYSDKK